MAGGTGVLERQDDFVEKIQRLAIEDRTNEAVEEILGLDKLSEQIGVLYALGLSMNTAIDLHHIRDLDRVRDLTRSLTRTIIRDLARTLDLARALDLDFTTDLPHIRVHDRIRTLTHDIARDLDFALDLARVINLEHDLDLDLESMIRITNVIVSVLTILTSDFYLTGTELTPSTLVQEIAPYLNAMSEIQRVLSELQGKAFVEPQIESIKAGSAIFNVQGLGETITAFHNLFRRRKNRAEAEELETRSEHQRIQAQHEKIAAQKARLDLKTAKRQYLIDNDPDLTELERKAKREDILLEQRQKRLELRKQELEIEEQEQAIAERRVKLAQTIADEFLTPYFPEDMPMHERVEYIVRVIPHLQTVLDSKLTLMPGKPTTLPEQKTDNDAD